MAPISGACVKGLTARVHLPTDKECHASVGLIFLSQANAPTCGHTTNGQVCKDHSTVKYHSSPNCPLVFILRQSSFKEFDE